MTKCGILISQTNSDYIRQIENFRNTVDVSMHACTHTCTNANRVYYLTEGKYLSLNTGGFHVHFVYAPHK